MMTQLKRILNATTHQTYCISTVNSLLYSPTGQFILSLIFQISSLTMIARWWPCFISLKKLKQPKDNFHHLSPHQLTGIPLNPYTPLFLIIINASYVLLSHLCSRFQPFVIQRSVLFNNLLSFSGIINFAIKIGYFSFLKTKTQPHLTLQFLLHFFCSPLQVYKVYILLVSVYTLSYLYLTRPY